MARKSQPKLPLKQQRTPFEQANHALREHYEKTKQPGYKTNQETLAKGKKILESILLSEISPSVRCEDAFKFSHWLETELDKIQEAATASLEADYLREILTLILDTLLVPTARLVNINGPLLIHNGLRTEGPEGDAERIGMMMATLAESAKAVDPDARYVSQELHTVEWLKLIERMLLVFHGGRIGGADPCTAVSFLLELIALDDGNRTGLKLLIENKWTWAATFNRVLNLSSVGLLTLRILRTVAAMVGTMDPEDKDEFLAKVFSGEWPPDVTTAMSRYLSEINPNSNDPYKPILYLNLVNAVSNDASIPRARGFQVTSLHIDGDDKLDSKRSKRRLEKGEIIVYVDPWVIVANSFEEDGTEDPIEFALERVVKFDHDDASELFFFRSRSRTSDDPQDFHEVQIGIQPDQVSEFKAVVELNLHLIGISRISGTGVTQAAGGYDGLEGLDAPLEEEELIMAAEQVEVLYSDRTAAEREAEAASNSDSGSKTMIDNVEEDGDSSPVESSAHSSPDAKAPTAKFRPPKSVVSESVVSSPEVPKTSKSKTNKKGKAAPVTPSSANATGDEREGTPSSVAKVKTPVQYRSKRHAAKQASDKTKELDLMETSSDLSSLSPDPASPPMKPEVSQKVDDASRVALKDKQPAPTKKNDYRTPVQPKLPKTNAAPKEPRVSTNPPPLEEAEESPVPVKASEGVKKVGAKIVNKPAVYQPAQATSKKDVKPSPEVKAHKIGLKRKSVHEEATVCSSSPLPWESVEVQPAPPANKPAVQRNKRHKPPVEPLVKDVFSSNDSVDYERSQLGETEDEDKTLVPETDPVPSSVPKPHKTYNDRLPQVPNPAKLQPPVGAKKAPVEAKKASNTKEALPPADTSAEPEIAKNAAHKPSAPKTRKAPVPAEPPTDSTPIQFKPRKRAPFPVTQAPPVEDVASLMDPHATLVTDTPPTKSSSFNRGAITKPVFDTTELTFGVGVTAMSTPKSLAPVIDPKTHQGTRAKRPSAFGYESESHHPTKKTRFFPIEHDISPGLNGEIGMLLRDAVDCIGEINEKRLRQPAKQILATQRRLDAAMAATAHKWSQETHQHLEAVTTSHKAVTAMYGKLHTASKRLAEESASRHQKVLFLLQNAPTPRMPDRLFE